MLTRIVADEIYNHLEENDLLPEEQKGCPRNIRVTKDRLLIDKAVMKNCGKRKVGLSMVWIEYRKAYGTPWYSTRGLKNPWRCVELQIISHLLSKSMEGWQTEENRGEAGMKISLE